MRRQIASEQSAISMQATTTDTRKGFHPLTGISGLGFVTVILLSAVVFQFGFLTRYPIERVRQGLEFPYQLDAEEGFLLNQSLRMVQGGGLYRSIDNPPYLVDNYPPLYPAICALFIDGGSPQLFAGRAISAISAFCVALGLFCAIALPPFPRGGRVLDKIICCLLGAVSGLIFLNMAEVVRWIAYSRVDLTAVAFSIWGLALFHLFGRKRGFALYAPIACFTLAFLTKQTAIAAPVACAIWMLLYDRHRAPRFLLALAAALILPALMLIIATHGQFWLHTVTYNRNVMNWNEIYLWLHLLMAFYPALVALVVIALVAQTWMLAKRMPRAELPDSGGALFFIYMLLNLASLSSLAKSGAAENYLLEPLAAAALFVCYFLSQRLPNALDTSTRPVRFIPMLLLSALLAYHAFTQIWLEPKLFSSAPSPNWQAYLQGEKIVKEIKERPGLVLSEDPVYPIIAGRPVLFQNFIMTELAREGKWDEKPVVEKADKKEFALIVAHYDLEKEKSLDRYSPALLEAIQANYKLLEKLDRDRLQPEYLYVPK